MRKYQSKRHLLTLSPLVALVLLCATSAHAFSMVTACGQKLAVPGQYLLTTDLDCTTTLANGIEITASDVTFELAGHTIASSDCDANKAISGIVIDSGLSGVTVEGGTVEGFNDGMVVYGSNSHVSAMTVTSACIFGIAISGPNNQLETSEVTLAGLDGIGIGAATGTLIRYNDISDNARVGVDISNFSSKTIVEHNIINRNGIRDQEQGGVAIFNGSNNLIANNALNNNFNGIEVESPNNLIRSNLVMGSLEDGIFITSLGTPSMVTLNTVLGSHFVDMSDDSVTCGGNTWKSNSFITDLAGGVANGGPGVGCIR
jgi:hypothetical protein